MSGIRVCRTGDVAPGTSHIVEVNGISIGIFNVNGHFYALLNRCPHRGAPLCKGKVTGLVTADHPQEFLMDRSGEVIRCPWHGWEFDILDGKSVFNPHRVRTRSYPVTTEPDDTATAMRAEQADSGLGEGTAAEGVPSYRTSVESDWVVVHLDRRTDPTTSNRSSADNPGAQGALREVAQPTPR